MREPTDSHIRFVGQIDDLITEADYEVAHDRKVIRFRLTVTDDGLEIVGDSPYPLLLETLLGGIHPKIIESMLCG